MKKILLAIDIVNPGLQSVTFAAYTAKVMNAELVVLLLENIVKEEHIVVKSLSGMTYVDWDTDSSTPEYRVRMKRMEKNLNVVKESLEDEGIAYSFTRCSHNPLNSLIDETRFCDLLIIDAALSLNKSDVGIPSRFLRNVLEHTECPVIVAPRNFQSIKEIVFAYDGSASSVFAIKMFTYLFPVFQNKPCKVVYVSKDRSVGVSNRKKMNEWLKNYYKTLAYHTRSGEAENELFNYLLTQSDIIVVMGAYGRSQFSNFFKPSTAEVTIKTNTHPIFIAHK